MTHHLRLGLLSLSLLAGCAAGPTTPGRAGPPAMPAIRPPCAVPPPGTNWPRVVAGGAAAGEVPPSAVSVATARQFRAAGERAPARAWLERAAAAAPDDPAICVELGDLLVADELELDRAGAMLLAVPAGHPGRDVALGRLAELRDDAETAQAAYARHVAVTNDPEIRLRRALALERVGRFYEATLELEQVRAADPANLVVHARLAERYEALGRLAEAEAELRALADAMPGRPEAWRRLAAFCGRHQRNDRPSCALARAREAEVPAKRELRPLLPTGR